MYREMANACISTSFIRKFDYREECEACGVDLSDGTGYECGVCGDILCENDLLDDQYGLPGYRGSIDDNNPDFQRLFDSGAVDNSGLAVCGQCMSQGEEEYESIMEEREEDRLRNLGEEMRRDREALGRPYIGYAFSRDFQEKNASDDEDEAFRSAWDVVKSE